MSILQSIFLGILQGIAEFLPISSSGQLVIAEHFMNLEIGDPVLMKTFDVILHAGSLVALLILFRQEIFGIFLFLFRKNNQESRDGKKLFILLIIGSFPAVVFGLLFEDFIDQKVRNINVVAVLMIITAIVFMAAENYSKKQKLQKIIKIKDAIIIGFFQAIAILPGVSRSGLTICGGLFQKLERPMAAKFSFLLAMPIIFGASLISVFRLSSESFNKDISLLAVLIGFIASALTSYITAKLLLKMFRKVSLNIFAVFLILEGLLIILF